MATSSSSVTSESSGAPKEFHISSSLDSGSRLSSSRQKCSLCHNNRKIFHCKDCVQSGIFYHSTTHVSESFLEKRKKLLELEEKKKKLEKKCHKRMELQLKADSLRSKIRQYRERNRLMKLAIEEKKNIYLKYLEHLDQLKKDSSQFTEKFPRYNHKVDQYPGRIVQEQEKCHKLHLQIDSRRVEVLQMIRIRVEQLKCIFRITKVEPVMEMEVLDNDLMSALAEASQTTYQRDKWEYTDLLHDFGEEHYSIVEPTLPASGNYSIYNLWVAQNKDAIPANTNADLVEHNPAYNISAALTYTAQMIHVLAFYFDVRLPFRMVCGDFCGGYMGEAQFTRRVARLNANILYLCLSQKIDLSTVKPWETILNILKLIDTTNPHMGREGPFDIDVKKVEILEKPLTRDLELSGDNTDSDEGDSFHKEWETVPHIAQDVPAPPLVAQSVITAQQTTSMASGLVTSAAAGIVSMWRGFTGR